MNILTFDIEEWFHILDNDSTKKESNWEKYDYRINENMERIFYLLDKHKLDATFFCLGWITRKFPEVVKKIDELGFEIAFHSNLHQLAYEQSCEEFETDFKIGLAQLENLIGKKIKTYRAPGFSITKQNLWAFDILNKYGITKDSSVFPANRAHGGISDLKLDKPFYIKTGNSSLKEFPINTFNFMGQKLIFSGGGYFRLFPKMVVDSLINKSEYVMTYFHPRDFDPEQPMIEELSLVRRFKSYYGLKSAFEKLDYILGKHEFMSLSEADKNYDWNNALTIDINEI